MAQTHAKSKGPSRTLGNHRASNDYTNGRLPLPPVQTNKTDYIAEGMIVSSMAVPPQKAATTSARKPSVVEPKPKSGGSPEMPNGKSSEEWERLLKEKDRIIKDQDKSLKDKSSQIRSKGQEVLSLTLETESLQSKIAALQAECLALKKDVTKKEDEIKSLQSQLSVKKDEMDYKPLYEGEMVKHQTTREQLETVQHQLSDKERQMSELEKRHADEVLTIRTEMEERMKDAVQKKDEELKEKDEKIQKLKKQMADAFAGSSAERQQQIDELSKELSKMQTECDNLKMKLRHGGHKSQSSGSCESCRNLKAHLEKKEQTIKEKNRTVDELTLVCGRYETQLKQQEELLNQWKDVKGRMLIFDK